MKAKDVTLALGPDVNPETVNWALWDGAKRGVIKKTGPGTFAALTYEPSTNDKDKGLG